jgi:hypothetical protein
MFHVSTGYRESLSEAPPKKPTKTSMSVSHRMFWFYRSSGFRVFLSDGSSKALQKKFYKKLESKVLPKIRPKTQNRFFLDFVYRVLGRYSVRRLKKHHKNKSVPGTFLASDPPTNHGVTDFFWRPLGRPWMPWALAKGPAKKNDSPRGWVRAQKKSRAGFIVPMFFWIVFFFNSPHRESPENVIKTPPKKSVLGFLSIFL